MNKQRRSEIQKIVDALSTLDIGSIGEEEQEAFDNLTEGLQAAERGQRMEEVAGTLSEAADTLADLITTLEGCLD